MKYVISFIEFTTSYIIRIKEIFITGLILYFCNYLSQCLKFRCFTRKSLMQKDLNLIVTKIKGKEKGKKLNRRRRRRR